MDQFEQHALIESNCRWRTCRWSFQQSIMAVDKATHPAGSQAPSLISCLCHQTVYSSPRAFTLSASKNRHSTADRTATLSPVLLGDRRWSALTSRLDTAVRAFTPQRPHFSVACPVANDIVCESPNFWLEHGSGVSAASLWCCTA